VEVTEGDPLLQEFPAAELFRPCEERSAMSETSDREARAAQNELVFRAVNEQIVKMTDRFRAQLADIDIVCECANTSCVGTILINAYEFAKIERVEGRFLVLPGHEDESVERVVERLEDYVIVWKPVVSMDGTGDGAG